MTPVTKVIWQKLSQEYSSVMIQSTLTKSPFLKEENLEFITTHLDHVKATQSPALKSTQTWLLQRLIHVEKVYIPHKNKYPSRAAFLSLVWHSVSNWLVHGHWITLKGQMCELLLRVTLKACVSSWAWESHWFYNWFHLITFWHSQTY